MTSKFIFEWLVPVTVTTTEQTVSDRFITARKGNAYEWQLSTVRLVDGKFGIYLHLTKGSAETVDAVTYIFRTPNLQRRTTRKLVVGTPGWGWQGFDDILGKLLHFTLEIPDEAFNYCQQHPFVDVAPMWLFKNFVAIEIPPTSVGHIISNLQLESSDGRVFYVQKHILRSQSEPLAMIINRDAAGKSPRIRLPTYDNITVRALLHFLYLGLTPTATLSTPSVISLLDAAEQYELPVLKSTCAATLWTRASDKHTELPDIIVAADKYSLKGLKMHAIALLVDNYERVNGIMDVQARLSRALINQVTLHAVRRSRCSRI